MFIFYSIVVRFWNNFTLQNEKRKGKKGENAYSSTYETLDAKSMVTVMGFNIF